MKMSLNSALEKLNALGKKNHQFGLNEQEQAEFESLSAALDQFDLSNGHHASGSFYNGASKVKAGPTGPEFRTPTGTIRAYNQHDKFNDAKMEEGEAGEMIKALLLGSDKLPNGFQKIANSHGSDPSGSSYMVPQVLSKQLFDLARAKAVCVTANVPFIPLTSGNMVFVRTTADPTVTWRGDRTNAWHDISASSPTFDTVTLNLLSAGSLVPLSLEFIEDTASNGVQWIEQVMSQAVATALDQAVLVGAGGSEPTGIVNTTNVNLQASVGSISDHSEVVTAISDVLSANYPGNPSDMFMISHPKVWAAYQNLTSSSTDINLEGPQWYRDLRKLSSTTMVTSSDSPDTYLAICGDLSKSVIVGTRPGSIQFELIHGSATDGGGSSYNSLTGFGLFARVWVRLAVGVLRPGFLSVLNGIVA